MVRVQPPASSPRISDKVLDEFAELFRLEAGDFFPHRFWDWVGDEIGNVSFQISDFAELSGLPGGEG